MLKGEVVVLDLVFTGTAEMLAPAKHSIFTNIISTHLKCDFNSRLRRCGRAALIGASTGCLYIWLAVCKFISEYACDVLDLVSTETESQFYRPRAIPM